MGGLYPRSRKQKVGRGLLNLTRRVESGKDTLRLQGPNKVEDAGVYAIVSPSTLRLHLSLQNNMASGAFPNGSFFGGSKPRGSVSAM